MWDFIGILGLLATFVAVIGTIVMGIKKNILWKKWLSATGIAFIVFIVGAVNAPTSTDDKKTITAPPPQQQTQFQPDQQSQPQPEQQSQSEPKQEQQSQPEQRSQTEQSKINTNQIQSGQQPAAAKATTPPPQSTAPAAVKTPAPQAQKQSTTVYITRTGEKYHRDGCRYLSRSKIPISLSDAKSAGYGPCSVCNPPH
jgi:cytoskeletal protein RodZ